MLWFFPPLFDHKISITTEAASGCISFLGFLQRNLFLVVDVNYPDRSATTILAGGSGE